MSASTTVLSPGAAPNIQPAKPGAEIIQDNLDFTLFSWSKQKGISPIAVKYGEGVYLYDYDGKKYIDFSSGLMNVNIGHGDQRITGRRSEANAGGKLCYTELRNESKG
jgi:taurine--2-oxoglutarate transaminase